MKIQIRKAKSSDVPHIFSMLKELAKFEKLSKLLKVTEEVLLRDLFGSKKIIFANVAQVEDQVIGYAIYFYNYSTFLGKKGIYLEDLYVKPKFRKLGAGKKLLSALIEDAKKNSLGRVEWSVLDWNQNAIDFYKSMGAEILPDWRTCRVTI
jgi:GNAT superfamily N-acetyltransferase